MRNSLGKERTRNLLRELAADAGPWSQLFRPTERSDTAAIGVLSVILVGLWSSRLFTDQAPVYVLTPLLVLVCVILSLRTWELTDLSWSGEHYRLELTRRGPPMSIILEAQIGSALVFAMMYYLVITLFVVPGVPAQVLALTALLICLLLFPVVPAASQYTKLKMFKTTVTILGTIGGTDVIVERLNVSPIDPAYGQATDVLSSHVARVMNRIARDRPELLDPPGWQPIGIPDHHRQSE